MITTKDILKALSHVDDPDLKKDIVTLGMVKDIEIVNNDVSFSVVLTTPACPMKDMIHKACVNAVKLMVQDVNQVTVNMTSEVSSTKSKSEILPMVKNIIGVASGKGGVGKSTIAANLAVSLNKSGAKVGLLDADIYGPSIPILMGLRASIPEMKDGKMIPLDKDGIQVLSIGFLIDEKQPVVWRGPMISSAFRQFINDVHWANLDYLIIDLPPGTGDIHLTLSQLLPLTGIVMVTTPQQVAIADCRKAMSMYKMEQINIPILGIVENMSWFTPHDMPEKQYYIFGKGGADMLSAEFDVPVLAQIPLEIPIGEQADNGTIQQNSEHNIMDTLSSIIASKIAILNAKG